MTAGGPLVAGIDVGNSTTEVVLGRCHVDPAGAVEVVAAGRAPTRGAKGSPASLAGAAALVTRLERRHGVRAEVVVAAPLRPVTTSIATVPEAVPDTGRLSVVAAGAGTAGGVGVGAGRPWLLGSPLHGEERVVALVPAGTGYRAALPALAALAEAGRLAAVVLGDDEAVLVANRLPVAVPVVDECGVSAAQAALAAQRLAVEVSDGGRPLQTLTDPLRLGGLLGVGAGEHASAAALARLLLDASNAVVALGIPDGAAPAEPSGWVRLRDGTRHAFAEATLLLRSGPVGLAAAYALPDVEVAVDDLWPVDLAVVTEQVAARRAGTAGRPVGLAALHADAPYADPAEALAALLGRPVRCAPSEAAAARLGALTTPGAVAAGSTVVVDLGGGTIDTVGADAAVVAAGGGELLTASVAALTGVTAAAAEHVKRGPAQRVEAPQVLLGEDGSRSFLDRPAPPETVGMLVVRGPAGLLPFHRTLAPGEWRALRLRLKVDLLGANVARALRTLEEAPRTVIVVGGPAGDDEVLAAVSGALPAHTAVARGNVTGSLGHRHAVAAGLLATPQPG